MGVPRTPLLYNALGGSTFGPADDSLVGRSSAAVRQLGESRTDQVSAFEETCAGGGRAASYGFAATRDPHSYVLCPSAGRGAAGAYGPLDEASR